MYAAVEPLPVNISLLYEEGANLAAVTVPSPGTFIDVRGEVPNVSIRAPDTGAVVNVSVVPDKLKCVPGY